MKKFKLVFLFIAILGLLCSCAYSKSVKEYYEAVENIGTITTSSWDKIREAEKVYNSLTEDEQKSVEFGKDYIDKRSEYFKLKGETQAQIVIEKLNNLGEITLSSKGKVVELREEFSKLNSYGKAAVTNSHILFEAEDKLTQLQAERSKQLLEDHLSYFYSEEDVFEETVTYIHKDIPEYIDLEDYIAVFVIECNNHFNICIRYDSVTDIFIGWDNIIIWVDGVKYNKTFDYYDVKRNIGFVTSEHVNESLPVDADMSNEDILMLKAIAESEKTIIRFQGSNKHYDYIVSNTDKGAIYDALCIYEGFLGLQS